YDPNFTGGVTVAAGNLSGTGSDDIITGAGPGGGPHVRTFNLNGTQLSGAVGSFYAYDARFNGGVFVAAGDVFGTGHDDIITGPGAGGGPNVKVFSGQSGATLRSFMAGLNAESIFDDDSAGFRGGVRVAAVARTAGGRADIIVGFGPPGEPI